MLKLKPPPKDPKIKKHFHLRQSTLTKLDEYAQVFAAHYAEAMPMDELVDQMLVEFMAGDRAFQKTRSAARGDGQT